MLGSRSLTGGVRPCAASARSRESISAQGLPSLTFTDRAIKTRRPIIVVAPALLAGCISVGHFVSPETGLTAPENVLADCRLAAQRKQVASPDTLGANPPPAEKIGQEIGSSIGDAILFRSFVKQCMADEGYLRAG